MRALGHIAPTLALDPETGMPIFPSAEVWASLDAAAQAAVLDVVREALATTADTLLGESTRHSAPGRETVNQLELHFRRRQRGLFIAQGLAVCYPDEATFSPDVMAVLDVPLGERDAWIVSQEGRGLDVAIEILVHGDRKKDLVTNVARCARLGIPEYFVFDVPHGRLLGYRLPPGASRYVAIMPQYGRVPCETLGLELAVTGGRLRFYHGGAQVLGPAEEVELLSQMVEERERALQGEADRLNAAEARAETEAARAETEAARAETAIAALRDALLALLTVRGLAPSPAQAAALAASTDAATLALWSGRAATATTADDVFGVRQ